MLWNLYIYINALKSTYLYFKRWKVLTFYLDGSRGIYTLWTLLFLEKEKTILMGDKCLLHIINKIINILSLLRNLVYTYEYEHDYLSCL
jgi:hypothetical protein